MRDLSEERLKALNNVGSLILQALSGLRGDEILEILAQIMVAFSKQADFSLNEVVFNILRLWEAPDIESVLHATRIQEKDIC